MGANRLEAFSDGVIAILITIMLLGLAVPATGWITSTGFAPLPVATYGLVFLLAAVACYLLAPTLVALHGPDSVLAEALGRDWKGKGSLLVYLVAVPLAFISSPAAMALNVLVALMWMIPDRRIEARVKDRRA